VKELARYDGKDGSPAYIAYKRKVYDVSHSYHWKDGKHQVLHHAGQDLTEAMISAPHGEELMKKMPVIGKMSS